METHDLEDRAFDERLPERLRIQAPTHFTPIAVARHAAHLLAPRAGMVVLDVGAGVGKFCLTAAREVESATFVGVEWRPHLVELARELARRCTLSNACFISSDAFELDWTRFDAFYLFNPFAEQLNEGCFMLDRTIQLHPANYVNSVMSTLRRLANARVDTRLVTYQGFGATPPPSYELVRDDRIGRDRVSLWIKTRSCSSELEVRNP